MSTDWRKKCLRANRVGNFKHGDRNCVQHITIVSLVDDFQAIYPNFRPFNNKILFFRYISPEKFYVEPRDLKHRGEKVLEIDRISQELLLAGDNVRIS